MEFSTKVGDTRNTLSATLTTASGTTPTDVDTIFFRMSNTLFANVIDRAVDIEALPVVGVIFTPEEVAEAGNYYGEFLLTYTDGKVETYPNVGYIKISITKNVGGA